jgi:SAM-dependent methyltransferase
MSKKNNLMINEGIRAEERHLCLLCDSKGAALYQDLRDRLFAAPGTWAFRHCPECGLVWLDPRPILEDIGKVYTKYCTHTLHRDVLDKIPKRLKGAILANIFGYSQLEQSDRWRWLRKIISLIPTFNDMVGSSLMFLKASDRGRLIDIGCGNSQFLAQMRDLGWQVLGIEPDTKAASVARDRFEIPVIAGTIESADLPESFYDAVSMNHVIEHVYDPAGLFQEIYRILKPKGKVVVLTPNVESLGHKLFRSSWRGLEPPRHLYLFTSKTLQLCAEKAGFSVETSRTTARNARSSWTKSKLIQRGDKTSEAGGDPYPSLLLEGYAFQLVEEVIRWVWKLAGEELLMLAMKPEGLKKANE